MRFIVYTKIKQEKSRPNDELDDIFGYTEVDIPTEKIYSKLYDIILYDSAQGLASIKNKQYDRYICLIDNILHDHDLLDYFIDYYKDELQDFAQEYYEHNLMEY